MACDQITRPITFTETEITPLFVVMPAPDAMDRRGVFSRASAGCQCHGPPRRRQSRGVREGGGVPPQHARVHRDDDQAWSETLAAATQAVVPGPRWVVPAPRAAVAPILGSNNSVTP